MKRLSLDRSIACATCHDPKRAFTEGRRVARGIHGAQGTRNAPALLNRGYGTSFFWDGRAPTLEQQVLEPIYNPKELGLTPAELERRTGMAPHEIAAALASYVRSIRAGASPVDRYLAGEGKALTAMQALGLRLFRGRANCVACHVGPNFTDEQFHNTGVAWRDGRLIDPGRSAVTNRPEHSGAFKTPTLREVSRTAPYMHDGTLATIEDVVEFYDQGARPNPYMDLQIRPLRLTSEEKLALAQFLRALTGKVSIGWR